MKKTTVEMGEIITVSVEDGSNTVKQKISPEVIAEVQKDLDVDWDAATKFLVTFVSCELRNLGDSEAGQKEFLNVMMEAVKNKEEWAKAHLNAFAKQILPSVQEAVDKAVEQGQDEATAVSIGLGIPMEVAKSFVASARLRERGLTEEQLVEIIVAGFSGESKESIAERFGLTDDES